MNIKVTNWFPGDPPPENGILLIRHGPREDPDVPPLSAMLTPIGEKESIACGSVLSQFPPIEIRSSPVQRCLDTGEKITEGAGWDIEVIESEMLGHPGPFVIGKNNEEINHMVAYAQEHDDWSFLRDHVNGKDTPGMRHRDVGTRNLVEELYPKTKGFVLCVSHDSIIAAVKGALGLNEENWPSPLCGCIIERI